MDGAGTLDATLERGNDPPAPGIAATRPTSFRED